jgi:hypothetical protein
MGIEYGGQRLSPSAAFLILSGKHKHLQISEIVFPLREREDRFDGIVFNEQTGLGPLLSCRQINTVGNSFPDAAAASCTV